MGELWELWELPGRRTELRFGAGDKSQAAFLVEKSKKKGLVLWSILSYFRNVTEGISI
jgi:hypothetical protein